MNKETKDLVEDLIIAAIGAIGIHGLVKQNGRLIRENKELATKLAELNKEFTEYKKNSEKH